MWPPGRTWSGTRRNSAKNWELQGLTSLSSVPVMTRIGNAASLNLANLLTNTHTKKSDWLLVQCGMQRSRRLYALCGEVVGHDSLSVAYQRIERNITISNNKCRRKDSHVNLITQLEGHPLCVCEDSLVVLEGRNSELPLGVPLIALLVIFFDVFVRIHQRQQSINLAL